MNTEKHGTATGHITTAAMIKLPCVKSMPVRLAAWTAVLAAALCAGCGSVRTDVSLGAPVRAHWRVVVLPLNDRDGRQGAMENSIYGATGTQGSSTVAAQGVSWALGAQRDFEIISPVALRAELDRGGFTLREAALLDSGKACDIARNLQADMVVLGRVPRYENAWFLFFPCAKVSLTLQAYDPSNYRPLWSAEVSGKRLFYSERRLVLRLVSEAAEEVHERLVNGSNQ